MQLLNVTKREAGQRLDKFLARFLNQAPKSFIYKMLRKKNIVLNNKKADGSEKLTEKDQIKLFLADETIDKFSRPLVIAKDTSLDVVYEDKDVIFINKPVGVLSQKAMPADVSMNEQLISYMITNKSITSEELRTFHPAVCNRLDRNTSGILLAGKTMSGLQELSLMLKERTIHKFYLCVVVGKMKDGAHIKGYLHKNESNNKVTIKETEDENSSLIETAYEPLVDNEAFTLVKVELITGRTHQIRSHLASINYPIVGDAKYGDKKVNQQFKKKYELNHQLLHAWYVVVENESKNLPELKTGKYIAPLHKLFEHIMKVEHLEEY